MSLEIIPYKPKHALKLAESGTRVPKLVLGADLEHWAKMKYERGPAVTAIDGEKIVGCGGLELLQTGLSEAWAVFCEDVGRYHSIPRRAKEHLAIWIKQHNLFRVQSHLSTDFPAGVKFAKLVGFHYEGFKHLFFPGGIDAWEYVILKERNVKKWQQQ